MAKKNQTPAVQSNLDTLVEEVLKSTETITIKQAVTISGLSEVYIRKALKAGKLVATKVPVAEGSKNLRNEITVESFNAWRQSAGTHSKREDGRGKFVLYMNPDEEAKMNEFLANGFTGIVARANFKKAEVAAE